MGVIEATGRKDTKLHNEGILKSQLFKDERIHYDGTEKKMELIGTTNEMNTKWKSVRNAIK